VVGEEQEAVILQTQLPIPIRQSTKALLTAKTSTPIR
jgi:hypothetical protein